MQQANKPVRQVSPAEFRRPGGSSASGHSVVELLLVVAILLVILAIALPRLVAARQSAQQVSAVVFLRNLHAAQEQFSMVHGQYAARFADLEGFQVSNGSTLAPPQQFPVGLCPLRNDTMPTLAFLLLPAPEISGETAYSGNGPQRPSGTEQHSSGGVGQLGEPAGAGNFNPPSGGEGGSNPDAHQNSRGPGGDTAQEQGGSTSGEGAGGSQGEAWSQSDRMTYRGYEFYLVRPTAHTWNCLAKPMRDERNSYHYFADQTGAIRREFGRQASAQSPIL
jgi:type II secretory pathway pseudopilin PulG